MMNLATAVGSLLAASAADGVDPQLTPGAVAATDPTIVCAQGDARAHRVWKNNALILQRYGVDPSRARVRALTSR